MTIRTRLTVWYAAVLTVSLLLISAATYSEFVEQVTHVHHLRTIRNAMGEASEIIFHVGLPAIIIGVAGGWWLTRRTLRPLADLTRAAREIDERTLGRPLPRSNNGDELDELTAVLNVTQQRLNDSFNRIRDFTLHASHELKTPLTIMHAELETALREDGLSGTQRDHLASQLEELQRLSKIVDGLTLLTKADAGQVKLKMEVVSLDALVRDIHADALILAEPTGVKIVLTQCDEIAVLGNAHRLRQLLLNLADNAVKYNHPGGSIAMALRRAGAHAELVIANTGPGIPAELLPRVFDRFFRGDLAHGSDVEGSGLGLSIAQWIAHAHGGAMQIESSPAKLTTVTLRLPVAEGKVA